MSLFHAHNHLSTSVAKTPLGNCFRFVVFLSQRRNTIRQDLKSRPIRRLFVDELQRYLIPLPNISPTEAINDLVNNTDRCLHEQRALLTWEQFELVVDLLDEALCQESQSEDTGIAPIVMELSTKFCTVISCILFCAYFCFLIYVCIVV